MYLLGQTKVVALKFSGRAAYLIFLNSNIIYRYKLCVICPHEPVWYRTKVICNFIKDNNQIVNRCALQQVGSHYVKKKSPIALHYKNLYKKKNI